MKARITDLINVETEADFKPTMFRPVPCVPLIQSPLFLVATRANQKGRIPSKPIRETDPR
jgi:hypothetical protein